MKGADCGKLRNGLRKSRSLKEMLKAQIAELARSVKTKYSAGVAATILGT